MQHSGGSRFGSVRFNRTSNLSSHRRGTRIMEQTSDGPLENWFIFVADRPTERSHARLRHTWLRYVFLSVDIYAHLKVCVGVKFSFISRADSGQLARLLNRPSQIYIYELWEMSNEQLIDSGMLSASLFYTSDHIWII